jgi:hypothetical protein
LNTGCSFIKRSRSESLPITFSSPGAWNFLHSLLSFLFSPFCPLQAVLYWLSSICCPALAFSPWLSYLGIPVLPV